MLNKTKDRKIDFENFLMEKHADQYVGTDNMMVDDYVDWTLDLDIGDIAKYANEYAKSYHQEVVTKLLEACRKAHECVVMRASCRKTSEEDATEDRKKIEQTIEILEQAIANAEDK